MGGLYAKWTFFYEDMRKTFSRGVSTRVSTPNGGIWIGNSISLQKAGALNYNKYKLKLE